ncbi:hypothetical protein FHS19_000810 [Paenibacillus rhizosphaerae]|uniref:Beta-hexosaminidase bacterial type N-terminal domain-containing protein n=1 Tax=Paenibacillus rhizosphaerae TaxID=297318 RepID=A0A839TH53_9BACL|nr:hypothetical protein [Paenibacillus rhizosphaerae]MBB3126156.1 hypothetical protein [Paenibacillus rhizosphaerae]
MLEMITIGYDMDSSPRIKHGVGMLKSALEACGYSVVERPGGWTWDRYRETEGSRIYVGSRTRSELLAGLEEQEVLLYHKEDPALEGFYLFSCPGQLTVVSGGDDSGALYGCQELSRIVREQGLLPRELAYGDAPRLVWRGPAVGIQKQEVEPGREPFEYPWTPDRFPWLYDKAMWLDYLDMLLEHRGNVLFLWNANPFSSLIDLPEEPEALEVTRLQLERNAGMLSWLADEADKRGIRVFLSFYSIHIPHKFADKHGLAYKQIQPTSVTSQYYRRLLSEFVLAFPAIGLMVCLGEQLKGEMYGAEWLCETILPGIMDGVRQSSAAEPPPVIVRSHGIEIEKVMEAAAPLYPNLHSEMKYNGESLTTWTPRGAAQKVHQRLGSRANEHVATIHSVTNLEPFRWGAPSFIQRCVQAVHYRLKASSLQFYPLSYWGWPYSPDRTDIRLKQMERDWIWFEAWLRYAWNPDRDARAERQHWIARLEHKYGSKEAGERILDAYEASGKCAPMLLRRFGITQGNRQTMSLGMTMSQLTNPDRYVPWSELWKSHAPPGERLEEYVLKDLAGLPHVGETPLDIVKEVERSSDEAYNAVNLARNSVMKGKSEFERFASDVEAIRAMTGVYTCKVRAAMLVLMYKHMVGGRYTQKVELLEEAADWVERSVAEYRRLTEITESQYWYAGGMQTRLRKVPFRDGKAFNHWKDCLPMYERELDVFRRRISELRAGQLPSELLSPSPPYERYRQSQFTLHSEHAELFRIEKGARVFKDGNIPIIYCAEELSGLTGIRFSQMQAAHEEMSLDIELQSPALVLLGYFRSQDDPWLKPTEREIEEIQRTELGPVLHKGLRLFAYPSVNIHALPYPAGKHTLRFGRGAFLIAGIIETDQKLSDREFNPRNNDRVLLDWLYEAAEERITP